MVGLQDPTCMHDVHIGRHCDKCQTTVGIDGPPLISKEQIWRSRSAPYGKVVVITAENGEVEWIQHEGTRRCSEADFRDEFWYWGVAEKGLTQVALEQKLEPILERIINAKEPETRQEATLELASAVNVFRVDNGFAPSIKLVARGQDIYCIVDWPSEKRLKEILRAGP